MLDEANINSINAARCLKELQGISDLQNYDSTLAETERRRTHFSPISAANLKTISGSVNQQ